MRMQPWISVLAAGLAAGLAAAQSETPPPVISNLSPGQLFVGQPNPVEIYGSGFLKTDRLTGVPADVTATWVSGEQITMKPVANSVLYPAVWCVDVVRGTGGETNTARRWRAGLPRNLAGVVQLPVIQVLEAVQPRQIAARSPDTDITVTGSRWTATMSPVIVLLDPSSRMLIARLQTTMLDEKTLLGRIPALQLSLQRQYAVSVWLTPHPLSTNADHCAADTTLPAAAPLNLVVGAAEEQLSLVSIDPVQKPAGSPPFSMRLTGTAFKPGAYVRWTQASGAVRELAADYRSSSLLETTISADLVATAGDATVAVVNADLKVSSALTFRITPVMGLAGISPTEADAGSGDLTLTVTGSAFARGAAVRWNGTALATTFVSETQLTALVPASLLERAGTATVSVTNPDGATLQATFTIRMVVALITGMSPGSAQVNSGDFTLTVTGRGFMTGAVVQWDGMSLPTTWRSAAQLDAQVSGSLLGSSRMVQITVMNPGVAPTDAVMFYVSPPPAGVLTYLEPASREAGSGDFTLLIFGQRFLSGAVVKWDGQDLPTTFRSASQLEAVVSGSRLARVGTAQITVANPGSAASPALTFTIVAPVVSAWLGGLNGTVSAASQGSIVVNFSASTPVEASGTLTAQFSPNAANLEPWCQPEIGLGFLSGATRTRTRTFVIGAGERSVSIPFETGTVAGTITVRLTALNSAGADVLQGRSVTSTITVDRGGPSIVANSVKIEGASGSGFDVTLSGVMPGRELTEAEYTFTAASTARLETTTVTVNLRTPALQWFQTVEGCNAGGRFWLRMPFTTANGDNTSVASVSVSLKNGSQTSGSVSGGR